jgi:hypothetical protein
MEEYVLMKIRVIVKAISMVDTAKLEKLQSMPVVFKEPQQLL